MPKERVVYGETTVFDADGTTVDRGRGPISAPEGGSSHTEPSVDIHWSRDMGHVQVAVEFPREAWLAIAEDLRNPGGESVTDKAIYTSSLSRYEINSMIRTLRRARDAAYGSDE